MSARDIFHDVLLEPLRRGTQQARALAGLEARPSATTHELFEALRARADDRAQTEWVVLVLRPLAARGYIEEHGGRWTVTAHGRQALQTLMTGILQGHQPCAPRRGFGNADRRPPVMRAGATDALKWPSVIGNRRVWPDGRVESLGGEE